MCVCRMYGVRVCFVRRERRRKVWSVTGDMAGDYETGTPDSAGEEEGTQERPLPQAGQLTAGEWNDNKNYEFFKSLFDKEIVAPQPTKAATFPTSLSIRKTFLRRMRRTRYGGRTRMPSFIMKRVNESLRRVEVKVKGADGNPAAGASVALVAKGETSASAYCATKTDANGKAYLFPSLSVEEYDVIAGYGEDLTARAQADENGYTVTLTEESRAFTQLDLCFMIDTTGVYGRRTRLSASGSGRRHFPRTDGTAERGYSARIGILSGFRGRVRRQKF